MRLRCGFPAFAIALTLGSCADPPAPQPAAEPVTTAPAKPKFKKPVRMNGRGELTSIGLEDFFLLHQSGKVLLFDARPAFIYHLGHIPGAINLTKDNCDEKIHNREAEIQKALSEGRKIVVYCSGMMCPDARTVAMHISGFGHPTSVFSGGWDAWRDAGMPTE